MKEYKSIEVTSTPQRQIREELKCDSRVRTSLTKWIGNNGNSQPRSPQNLPVSLISCQSQNTEPDISLQNQAENHQKLRKIDSLDQA
jgi:hypothetical protein